MILNYFLGYGAFLLGAALYILSKLKEYKQMADANPNPKVIFRGKDLVNSEWINLAQLFLAGIALVIFLPMLIGGTTVDIKNTSGNVVTTLSLKATLIPMYFLLGWSGNSAIFALFGKYKKTLLNQVGVDDENTPATKP